MAVNIFEKIVDGEIPCNKVFENERILAFKDIAPVASVHILIIPKKKGITSFQSLSPEDFPLLEEMLKVAQNLAKEFGVDKSGYRLVTNIGPDSGQEVLHIHFHLIGGERLGSMV